MKRKVMIEGEEVIIYSEGESPYVGDNNRNPYANLLHDIAPGECFHVHWRKRGGVRSAITRIQHQYDKKFTTKQVLDPETEVKMLEVRRVS